MGRVQQKSGQYIDFLVFIDTPLEVSLARMVLRDIGNIVMDQMSRKEAVGLVDSGATVNVLPYDIGLQLGELWEDRKATIKLAGNLGGFVFTTATNCLQRM